MAERSTIEWTEATWNPIAGCSVVSPGCTNCYAMRLAARLEKMLPPYRRGDVDLPNHYAALTKPSKAGAVWTGRINIAPDRIVTKPLRVRKPTTWFVNSMSDLFHDSVPDAWIDRMFAVMALAPQHTFQVLTKRSARMRAYMTGDWSLRVHDAIEGIPTGAAGCGWLAAGKPLPNVWLGVSAEDQRRADERVPDLLATPSAVRFVSAEPLLSPLDLARWLAINWQCSYCREFFTGRHRTFCPSCGREGAWTGSHAFNGRHQPKRPGWPIDRGSGLDWIIVGGESGPGARPMHPDWARSLRDQCAAAGVPFHFKQWGEFAPVHELRCNEPGIRGQLWHNFDPDTSVCRVGKKAAGRLLDGVEHNGMPEVRP